MNIIVIIIIWLWINSNINKIIKYIFNKVILIYLITVLPVGVYPTKGSKSSNAHGSKTTVYKSSGSIN